VWRRQPIAPNGASVDEGEPYPVSILEPGRAHDGPALATARPLRESAAEDEAPFLRGMIDGMRCGVLAIDAAGRLRWMNGLAREILELGDAPVLGTRVAAALARHPQLVRVLDEAFSMSSLPNRAEIELGSRPGAGKTVGFTLSHIRGERGVVLGSALFFKDLTRIEHQEEDARLRDRLAALGQMAASMAHEIRNPLASIEVTCTLLKRRLAQDSPARELVDKIVEEVRRVNSSVRASLEFVRPVSPCLTSSELLPLLDEAIAVAQERRGGGRISIERRYGRRMPAFLMDRALLRDVFVNLILNAMEAVGETQGRITVSAEVIESSDESSVPYRPGGARSGDAWQQASRFAVVRVADSGPGIGEEDRERIFDPFFTTKPHGSGVGLAVARKIVGSHRGLIDVDRASEGGAEFSVRLPMIVNPGVA
jgi:nitrogen-specific signal transduction histidine kinase